MMAATSVSADRPADSNRGPIEVDPIRSEEEGQRVIDQFRGQRILGDYLLRFRLEHRPRRAKERIYTGLLLGTWGGDGPIMRVLVWDDSPSASDPNEFLLRGGPNPAIFRRSATANSSSVVPPDQWQQPLTSDVVYTPFDILMPYVYWENFDYAGSRRFAGRPTHFFDMKRPSDSEAAIDAYRKVSEVEIGLDADFNALRRARVFDNSGNISRVFEVRSFKKLANEQFIVKEIDLTDRISRDMTRFKVTHALTGIALEPSLFLPDALGDGLEAMGEWSLEKI